MLVQSRAVQTSDAHAVGSGSFQWLSLSTLFADCGGHSSRHHRTVIAKALNRYRGARLLRMHLSTSAGIEKPEYFGGRNQSAEPKDVLNGEAPVRQFVYSRQPRSAGNYAPRTMADEFCPIFS
jgi:hypothetical protein